MNVRLLSHGVWAMFEEGSFLGRLFLYKTNLMLHGWEHLLHTHGRRYSSHGQGLTLLLPVIGLLRHERLDRAVTGYVHIIFHFLDVL